MGVDQGKPNETLEAIIDRWGVTGLAARVGVSEGTVRNWRRNGKTTPVAARLLSGLTGAPVRALEGIEDSVAGWRPEAVGERGGGLGEV